MRRATRSEYSVLVEEPRTVPFFIFAKKGVRKRKPDRVAGPVNKTVKDIRTEYFRSFFSAL